MTERRDSLAERLRLALKHVPANGCPPKGVSAGDVLTIVDFAQSMDFMVNHFHLERMRIVRALGLQVEGPDADQDGYPDLAGILAARLDSMRGQIAYANERAWKAEERLSALQRPEAER